jgi:hypothetical protein
MKQEPQAQHRWLERLVGDWTFDSSCDMGPDQPPMQVSGTERVRSLGGLWVIAEAEHAGGEEPGRTIMTLGYDPQASRFVGTFIASVMTYLWSYRGTLDESTSTLTLDAEGPDFAGTGMAQYQDVIAFSDDHHRTLTSRILGPDRQWRQFMQIRYRRTP